MLIASCRHSRRTANHRSPIPGVIFVSRGIAHQAERATPVTATKPISVFTLPARMSHHTGGKNSPSQAQRPRIPYSASNPAPVRIAANIGSPSAASGANRNATGGL